MSDQRARRSPDMPAQAQQQVIILQSLARAVAAMQSVAELGRQLKRDLFRLHEFHSLVLATYLPADDRLQFETVVVNGQPTHWPSAAVSKHPFRQALRSCTKKRLAAGILSDQPGLVLPLCYAGTAVGVLALGPADQKEFLPLLEAIAALLATAIHTSLHLGALETTLLEQAGTLSGLGEIVRELNATLDVMQIGKLILRHAMQATSARVGAVFLIDQTNTLQLLTAQGDGRHECLLGQAHSLSVAQLHTMTADREYQIVPDAQVPATMRLWNGTVGPYMVVRLRRDDYLIGCLVLAATEHQRFSMLQINFVQQLAGHAALTLTNASAYRQIIQQRNLLDQRLAQLQAVAYISQAISAQLNVQALLPEIVGAVRSTLGYRTALLSLLDESDPGQVRRVAAVGVPDGAWATMRDQVVPFANYQVLMTEKFQVGRSFFIPSEQAAPNGIDFDALLPYGYRADLGERAAHEWHSDDVLIVPLYGHLGKLIGILSVDDPDDQQRPSPEMITVLEIFATQAATAIETARMYTDMERQALTDNLTELPNQRHFMTHLTQHRLWAERHQQALALLALDIDHFKSYNDQYGHLDGNVLLREFTQVVHKAVRTSDLVARWGGEEFCALLPQSTVQGALEVAERIREAVHNHQFRHRSVTVSIGVAAYQPGMDDEALLQAADAALYRAKRQRNTVAT